MQENSIKSLLNFLSFKPKNGADNVYIKNYPLHNYDIEVDFNNQKINYGNDIVIGNNTTSNFSKPENFVVLECVNRLLEKGYKPMNIELEKIYPSGRGHSGNLDILVYDDDHKAYLMIECKTVGIEHNKEHNKMVKDGGQLFSYYALDRDTKYLCLYSSSLNDGVIEYKNDIIPVEEEWKLLSTSKEIHTHWNKSFKDNGIFERYANPYKIKHKTLTYEMLVDLKEADSGKIFNQIMEILRHNVVSDKPNAFNKLLNLFVCKIIDENKNPTDELKFQWLENDTDETLQMRLNDLYKEGMWRFLNINVTDYSENEVNNALQGVQADDNFKQTIRNMFRDTRLKKSPNFAFKEVLDEKSFRANAKIVKEIVKLLQGYKFRYRQKHQFLGDFFELLLNTSMKQEAGQFFTPVPITRFIISSLPIKELIISKIKNNDNEMLPVVIDYATGSGHFLTEYMEQVQTIIENLGISLNTSTVKTAIDDLDISVATPAVKNKLKTWIDSEKFIWAKDYVYGIELDDRLVKTAKVSAFFNGDGEANIIWSNGLDNFEKSTEYRDKLRKTQVFDKKNNGQFDILISNPPYSVEAFKATLRNGEETFELYNSLTDNSSEIECLFVERMKQLLKIGGWAGIILPISILSNGGIHSKAREIIFKYFEVKSIVELGSGTFMKTGTNTIILFLERKSDGEYKEIEIAIDKFLNDNLDVTVTGIEKAFSKYVTNVYENLNFEDYIKILKGKEIKHELYKDYKKEFNGNVEQIKQLEKEKLLYFILTYNQEVTIIKTGKKQEAKKFLGYEFSERRGHEGLKWLPKGTKLYNEDELLDKTKANSYVYNSFKGIKNEVDETLSKNVSYRRMSELFEYGTSKFDKRVNLNKKTKIISRFSLESFNNLFLSKTLTKGSGYTFPKELQGNKNSNLIPFYKVSDMNTVGNEIYLLKSNNYIDEATLRDKIKGTVFPKGATVFPNVGEAIHTNKKRMLSKDAVFDNNVMAIWSNDEKKIIGKYLYLFMTYFVNLSDYASQASPPSINNIGDIKIPLPSIEIQQKIIVDIEKIENEYNGLNVIIEQAEKEKTKIISECFNGSYMLEPLGNITEIFNGGTPDTKNQEYWNGNINWATLVDTKNKYLYTTNRKITDKGLNSCNATLVPINTVLFSSRATIGDVSIAKVEVATNQGYKNFVCQKDKLYYEYLYYILKYEAKNIENLASGMTYPEISKTMISQFKIPLPSIDRQKEIVARIEKYEKIIFDGKNKLEALENTKKIILENYLK